VELSWGSPAARGLSQRCRVRRIGLARSGAVRADRVHGLRLSRVPISRQVGLCRACRVRRRRPAGRWAAVRFVRQQLAKCRQVRAASLHDHVTRRRIGSPSTWRNSSAATTVYAARYSCARRDEPDRRMGDRQRVVDITERVLTGSLAVAFILGRLPNASLLGKRCHSNNVWIKFNVRRWSRSQQDSN